MHASPCRLLVGDRKFKAKCVADSTELPQVQQAERDTNISVRRTPNCSQKPPASCSESMELQNWRVSKARVALGLEGGEWRRWLRREGIINANEVPCRSQLWAEILSPSILDILLYEGLELSFWSLSEYRKRGFFFVSFQTSKEFEEREWSQNENNGGALSCSGESHTLREQSGNRADCGLNAGLYRYV